MLVAFHAVKMLLISFLREKIEQAYDPAAFDTAMTSAVDETVAKQVKAGVDIVSDGRNLENFIRPHMSKTGTQGFPVIARATPPQI